MFDLATQPQSAPTSGGALALPFDWRLTAPAGLANYPYTDFSTASGIPQVSGEMLATYALALEDGLQTAVILSLFTDGRADRDAVLPLNQTDRRGWVGDEFMGGAQGVRQDAWGCGLWLVYISKVTPDVLERARFTAQEALAWLVRDGIASRVVVTAQWSGPALDRLALRCAIYKSDQLQPVYDVLWGTTLRRLDALAAPEGTVACCDPSLDSAPPAPPDYFTSVLYGYLADQDAVAVGVATVIQAGVINPVEDAVGTHVPTVVNGVLISLITPIQANPVDDSVATQVPAITAGTRISLVTPIQANPVTDSVGTQVPTIAQATLIVVISYVNYTAVPDAVTTSAPTITSGVLI